MLSHSSFTSNNRKEVINQMGDNWSFKCFFFYKQYLQGQSKHMFKCLNFWIHLVTLLPDTAQKIKTLHSNRKFFLADYSGTIG